MRCDEFYEKWRRCGNFCEKHPETAREIEKLLDFIDEHPDLSVLSAKAVRPLIREKDPVVRDKAIVSVGKSLESKKNPATGRFSNKPPTERDVKKVIQQVKKEIKPVQEPVVLPASGFDAFMACETDDFDLTGFTIPAFLQRPPDSLQYTNLWMFTTCDPEFGEKKYPGRMPGQIIENLVWYYTKPFDVVYDPMAGSGTTLDVCRKMYRRVVGFDLNPIVSKGIKQNNVMNGFPKLKIKDKPMLIVLDPPYAIQKQGEYTEHDTDLSNMSIERFYDAIGHIADECIKLLHDEGIVAFIISSLKTDGHVEDLGIQCRNIFVEHGFDIIERVCVPYNNAESMTGYWIANAKKNKWMLRAYRDLLIMKRHDI